MVTGHLKCWHQSVEDLIVNGETGRYEAFMLEKGWLMYEDWYFVVLRLHVAGGIVCLIALLPQFSPRLLKTSPKLHRWSGRLYGISALLFVCLAGMPMAVFPGWWKMPTPRRPT